MTDAKKTETVQIPGRMSRPVEIDPTLMASRAANDERIPVSVSSDAYIERAFGYEVLDHSADAVDMSRAKDGLPLRVVESLDGHEQGFQVGRVEELRLEGGKMRGFARFSESARASEIKKDFMQGIRKELSIGYEVRAAKHEGTRDGRRVFRATKWGPYEISNVPVPADISVGVGRAASGTAAPVMVEVPLEVASVEATNIEVRAMPDEKKTTETATVTGGEDRAHVERGRVRALTLLAREHKVDSAVSDKWVEDGVSIDSARAAVLDQIKATAAANPVKTGTMEDIGVSEKDRKEYSLTRAMLGAADDWAEDSFERKIHFALRKQARAEGYTPQGNLMVPLDMPMARRERAGLDSKTTTAGLELKFTEPGSFIELLRAATRVIELGATYMPGLQGNVAFPRQTGAGTFTWVAENPGSDVAESNLALDQVTISPKLGQSTTSYSRNLLAQAVVDVEAMVRNDLALITAIAIDIAAIAGTGASNQPKGIISQTGVGSVTLGANGGTISWNNLVDVIKTVEAANAARGRLAWLTTPGQKAQMSKIAQISAATGVPVWYNNNVAGYDAATSTNVPSNLTKGTSTTICHAILFGNWQELLIGQWNALDIIVDPYRLKKQGMIEVTSYVSVDVAVRHGPSFCVVPDAL